MTQYANFDHTVASPSPVTGWYDTEIFTYPILPDAADLLEIPSEQWDGRMDGLWAVSDGVALIAYTPVIIVSQADLTAIELSNRITAGITISSSSLSSVNGTYALDSVSTAQIFQIGLFASQFAIFPNGSTTQMYPDLTGQPHSFTVAIFIAFLRAVAPLVSSLETQAGIMGQGGTPTWPNQIISIV